MGTVQDTINQTVTSLVEDKDRMATFVNGNDAEEYTAKDGSKVPSLKNYLRRLGDLAGGLNIGNDGGVVVQQPFPGAVLRTQHDKNAENLNVMDFGAVGDGIADDFAAFQAALIAASQKKAVLRVPAGTFCFSQTLYMGADTTLKSSPKSVFLRKHNGTILCNMLDIPESVDGYDGNGNIVIDGGVWDSNPAHIYRMSNHFSIGYADKVVIRNVTFLNMIRAHSIDLSSCKNVLIEDCHFLGQASEVPAGGDGYDGREYAEAIQLDDNKEGTFGWGALNSSPCKNVTIRRCTFGSNPNPPDVRFGPVCVGVGSHGYPGENFHENIIIEHCTFDASSYAAVRPCAWKSVRIDKNVFNSCYRGVMISAAGSGKYGSGYKISGNEFNNTVAFSVFLVYPNFIAGDTPWFHENVTIDNNTFNGGSQYSAICAYWSKNLRIVGNEFNNNFRAIESYYINGFVCKKNIGRNIQREFIFASENTSALKGLGYYRSVNVSDNDIDGSGYSSINISNVDYLRIQNNTIINASNASPTRYGIYLNSCKYARVDGNSVIDGGAANKPIWGIYAATNCIGVCYGVNQSYGVDGSIYNGSQSAEKLFFGSAHFVGSSGNRPAALFESANDLGWNSGQELSIGSYSATSDVFTKKIRMTDAALSFYSIPLFADNAAASGLSAGDVYRTADGSLKVKY